MTLTQTAILVKQIIKISAIALVLFTVSFTGYRIWLSYYLAHLPPVEEKPDIKFGALPLPDLPKSNVSAANFTYSLDTATGSLPKIGVDSGFEKIIKVYFVTQTFATFLSPDRSQALAEKFGFTSLPEILSETKYRFRNQSKSLTIDLDNGNFSYTKEVPVSTKINPDDDAKLVSDFKQILSFLGVFKDDLNDARFKVTLLKTEGGKLIPTALRSETEAIQISLWAASIDKKSIFTADFNKSLINATIINKADQLDNYLSLNFTYYPIDTTTFATYPTKKAETAFEDLKAGKGTIIVNPDKSQISVTSVYLGYFLPENYSPYLQPIFIFEGPNFVAYVSAISTESQSGAK